MLSLFPRLNLHFQNPENGGRKIPQNEGNPNLHIHNAKSPIFHIITQIQSYRASCIIIQHLKSSVLGTFTTTKMGNKRGKIENIH
jgi:hypothetical protein